jgi:peptidoglycan/LPS O-acetylase OafA/YrhL
MAGARADAHANNFDLLRLGAAVSVIFSHAFLLAEGHQNNEPLVALTGQAVLGLMGVFIFFVISGFLVTQSYEHTRSTPRFLLKRFLRIYPGLTACLLFCALALGAAVTLLPIGDYFRSPTLHRFVTMNLLMQVDVNTLPGVVFTTFDIGRIVDGPLWSLPYELAMYAMVAVLGLLGRLNTRFVGALFGIGVAAALYDTSAWGNFVGNFLWLLPFFTAGMLMYKLQGPWLYDRRLVALAVVGLIISAGIHELIALFPIFGGYLVIQIALDNRIGNARAARFGDLSYGLYLYGWPVEQTLLWATGGQLAWWGLFALAVPITAGLAYLSWHLIEKPALSLKPREAARPVATRRKKAA